MSNVPDDVNSISFYRRPLRESRAFFALLAEDEDPWASVEHHPADQWTVHSLAQISINGSFT